MTPNDSTPASTPMDWNGPCYDEVAALQENWGRAILDRIPWRGGEAVLDAGCGTGRLLPDLLARVPSGRIFALDSSPAMLEVARRRAEQLASPVPIQFLLGSLTDLRLCSQQNPPPCLPEPVDVVFSNAVFHWIPDKLKLFSTLIPLMRPDARLLAQYGGETHLRRIRAAAYRAGRKLGLEPEIAAWLGTFHFIPASDAKELLKVCGFRQVRVWEQAEEARFPDYGSFERFCSAVLFRSFHDRIADEQMHAFLREFATAVQDLLGDWRLDAVRQNIDAVR